MDQVAVGWTAIDVLIDVYTLLSTGIAYGAPDSCILIAGLSE